MESKEDIKLGVTVMAGEAPSSYHLDPKSDNFAQVTRLSQTSLPLESIINGNMGMKKRGGPRKDGPVAQTLSTLQVSSAPPPAFSGFSYENQATSSAICASSSNISSPHATGVVSAEKPRKGRPIGSQNKPRHNVGSENIGELIACTSGGSFTPHTITVNAGEDVTRKITALSQQGPRAVCVISANGIVSNVTLRQLSSGETYTYEGMFDILSLSGSFTPATISGVASSSRVGSMSITLAQPDGHVVGGLLAGLLIAASHVQVVVTSFLPINHNIEKPKKHRYEHTLARSATGSVTSLPLKMEQNDLSPVVPNYADNHNGALPPMYQISKWPKIPMIQDSRKSTDINISLQEE
ncbi:AT-hook motif nuclear-localized protein 1-like isoform X1 [Apium graveolens]|uniref:AT-hook motif nuclear-localized protein 1-like isoform X1 n=1 Tax=Apium graveolens TaxID=4045 RepID=UPI003D7ACC69